MWVRTREGGFEQEQKKPENWNLSIAPNGKEIWVKNRTENREKRVASAEIRTSISNDGWQLAQKEEEQQLGFVDNFKSG